MTDDDDDDNGDDDNDDIYVVALVTNTPYNVLEHLRVYLARLKAAWSSPKPLLRYVTCRICNL